MPFYGLYVPSKGASSFLNDPANSNESLYVFREKAKALEVLKQHKEARLKEFLNEDDALEYAQSGYEIVQNKYNDIKTSTAAVEKATFRAPTKQELTEFRKIIEAGDFDRVREIIWENPRYLVSSGDTPTSLKEGCRYNAMHICALSNKWRIAELILKTVSNTEFADLLIGKKNDLKSSKELAENLLDYYLNMPEKGRSETPLHIASKFGCIEMVDVLTSFPKCNITVNKEGFYPRDIICTRAPIGVSSEVIEKIKSFFDERFYVPVIKSMDGATPPQVGQPFLRSNPPVLSEDPLSPEIKIQALAGPMSKEQAMKFARRWKTPPRLGTSSSSPVASSPFISPIKTRLNRTSGYLGSPNLRRRSLFDSPRRKTSPESTDCVDNFAHHSLPAGLGSSLEDSDAYNKDPDQEHEYETNNNQKGLPKIQENIQESLPHHMNTPPSKKLGYLFSKYRDKHVESPMFSPNTSALEIDFYDSPGYQERHIKITNTEKGLEMIGRHLAKEHNVEWKEYWDFLNSFIDLSSIEGLQQLENFFAQRKGEVEMKKKSTEATFNPVIILEDVCSALERFNVGGTEVTAPSNGFIYDLPATSLQQSTTPYTCIEKSLQVFAKRITKSISNNIENVTSINDTLHSELKRLKALICSFKEDTRFPNIDFTKVHSRIANLVAYYLNRSQDINNSIKIMIPNLLESLVIMSGEKREHIRCVCAKIIAEDQPNGEIPENINNEEMCALVWHREESCDCLWESNLSRKTSRRQRMEVRLKQMKEAEKQRRIMKALKNGPKGNLDQYRSNSFNTDSSADEQEDEIFCSASESSDSDEEARFYTPAESPSRLSFILESDERDTYKLFVFGDEPTKRDLDVLNAIYNVELDESKYPHISAWKAAISCYTTEELNSFPSPVKKSHSFSLKSPTFIMPKKEINPGTPYFHRQFALSRKLTSTPADGASQAENISMNRFQQQPQNTTPSSNMPFPKRLFMSPLRKTATVAAATASAASANEEKPTKPVPAEPSRPLTPFNRIRGLFSLYREQIDSSPLGESSLQSPRTGRFADRNESNNSMRISLLNVSSNE